MSPARKISIDRDKGKKTKISCKNVKAFRRIKKAIAVVLAAGEGVRMKSSIPKVLHTLLGKKMIDYVLDSIKEAGIKKAYIVVGNKKERVVQSIKKMKAGVVIQKRQLGSGHALLQAGKCLKNYSGDIFVTCGDIPLLTSATIKKLIWRHAKNKNHATVLATILKDPYGYGRLIKDRKSGNIKIVEEKEATKEEKKIKEVNVGIYCFSSPEIFSVLKKVGRSNKKGEYYLTDVIEILGKMGKKVDKVVTKNSIEVEGVNDRKQLKRLENYLKRHG